MEELKSETENCRRCVITLSYCASYTQQTERKGQLRWRETWPSSWYNHN